MKLYFHGNGVTDSTYRKYAPTTPGDINTLAWYTFPGAVFGSEVVGGNTVTTVELSLTDGALGDSTGVDGQIIDPGGPALFVPEPGSGAAFFSGLLMLRWLAQRRRGESSPAAG